MKRTNSGVSRWTPLLVGCGGVVVALWLGWALSFREDANVERMIAAEVAGVKNEISARMQARVLALVRMARRWENAGKPPQTEWEFEAELNLSHFPGYYAIAWADPWLFLRWAVPLEGDDAAQELNLVFDEQRRKAFEAVRKHQEVLATRTVELNPPGKGFLVYVPIFRGEDCAGVIIGVLRVRELLDSILPAHVAAGYGVALFDGNEEIYRTKGIGSRYESTWGQDQVIDLYGTPWRLRVWPQSKLLASVSSPLPKVVLAAGIGMAFLLALAVALAQTARSRARAIANANQELEREITERMRAEEEVRTLNDELEQRVIERTAQLADANADLEKEIVARARVEQALRDSEKRYRSLFENASDGIISCTLSGAITDVNWGLESMLGWSRYELVGQHYRKIYSSASVTKGEERIRRVLAGEKLPSLFEAEAVRRDGSIVPIEIRARFLRDKEGKPVGILATLRDISARRALEQQRSEFLTMLTHDIKSPLAVVLGYAELLLDEGENQTAEQRGKDLRQLRDNVRTVFSLVDNYLSLSLIEDGRLNIEKKPLELNDLLIQVGQQYEAEARQRNIALKFELQQELPPVEGDPLALGRVVGNLVYNALKFTPQYGRVTVSSTHRNGELVASVADTGPGIPTEEVPLLFEKYRRGTTSRDVEGTGLGLFIVKALVEAHGGHIEVHSTPDRGANFSVILPLLH